MRFWRRVPSLLPTLLLLSGVASGCHDRSWNFGYQVIPPDGGVVDAPKTDASMEHASIDLAGFGGAGGIGFGGAGGSGGGTGGAGGAGGVTPMCNPNSPDRLTDISNC